MSSISNIQNNTVLFCGPEVQRHVGGGLHLKGVQSNEGILESEPNAGEVFAVFTREPRRTLTYVILRVGRNETDAVLTVVLLTG